MEKQNRKNGKMEKEKTKNGKQKKKRKTSKSSS